jgi:GxxExxY protein
MILSKGDLKDLSYQINGAAIEVHKFLGPGLLESVYHKCMKKELTERGVSFVSELSVPVIYKGMKIDTDLRCDLFVENCIVVEFKSVEMIKPIFHAQLLTYMKLLKAPKGIIYNFNSNNLYNEGQQSFVNEYYKLLDEF